ncbi:MAG: hypothetical protein MI924_19560, partial [Chloroflexales bacterium]|nr:hypothetical protein [Chloroflexales bacterium]
QQQRRCGSTPGAAHPPGGQGHDPPDPGGAARVGHRGLRPAPPGVFVVVVAARAPGPHALPGHSGLIGR